jgi:hypothetical protein
MQDSAAGPVLAILDGHNATNTTPAAASASSTLRNASISVVTRIVCPKNNAVSTLTITSAAYPVGHLRHFLKGTHRIRRIQALSPTLVVCTAAGITLNAPSVASNAHSKAGGNRGVFVPARGNFPASLGLMSYFVINMGHSVPKLVLSLTGKWHHWRL